MTKDDGSVVLRPTCCFCISGRAGVITIASLYLVLSVLIIATTAVYRGSIISYIIAGLQIIFAIVGIIGSIKHNPVMIIVYASWLVLGTVMSLIVLGLDVDGFIKIKGSIEDTSVYNSYIIKLTIDSVIAFFSIYFSYVVIRHAIYLKKVEKEAENMVTRSGRRNQAGGV